MNGCLLHSPGGLAAATLRGRGELEVLGLGTQTCPGLASQRNKQRRESQRNQITDGVLQKFGPSAEAESPGYFSRRQPGVGGGGGWKSKQE